LKLGDPVLPSIQRILLVKTTFSANIAFGEQVLPGCRAVKVDAQQHGDDANRVEAQAVFDELLRQAIWRIADDSPELGSGTCFRKSAP
jgi:hypothetical protein